jgi:hypothetical protein
MNPIEAVRGETPEDTGSLQATVRYQSTATKYYRTKSTSKTRPADFHSGVFLHFSIYFRSLTILMSPVKKLITNFRLRHSSSDTR